MVELLSPAGEYDSFLGALSAGADAVYLAGNMYGARASAVNFTEEEIIKALNYAHLFGKKIYLTVNTLTKEEELDKLYDFIRPLYLSGLDACIVQDMGVFEYLKYCFPSMDIHISTQALVTSKEGARFYKENGASRVVLARELTLPEVCDINTVGIETECFIHGAMCYSYSGGCLFSSFLGGNSGNRGRCKGPCRQPYKIDGKEQYILSLKDMCTVEMINKLIDAGITSFKIEGRLKSPAYAAGVTSVYRKYIDRYLSNPDCNYYVDKEDLILLQKLYQRSGSGFGYYDKVKSYEMITFEKGSYNKVSDEEEKKISEKYVKNPLKLPVDVEFEALVGQKMKFTVCDSSDNNIKSFVDSLENIQAADNKPTSLDDISKHISKIGSTPFSINSLKVDINGGFVPASLINSLRRETFEDFYNKKIALFSRNDDTKRIELKTFSFIDASESYFRVFANDYNQIKVVSEFDFIDGIVVSYDILFDERFDEFYKENIKKLYFRFPQFLRKQNAILFDKCMEKIKKYSFAGVYLNQIDEYIYLKDSLSDMEICADANIYTYNSLSLDFYHKYFDIMSAPIELNYSEVLSLENNNFEVCLYQKAPLMQTSNCVLLSLGKCKKKTQSDKSYVTIKDRLNVDFPVRMYCNEYMCFNTIYNSLPTSLHKYYEKLSKNGFGKYCFKFTNESPKEVDEILCFYMNLINNKKLTDPSFSYTNGHIKNSIL